MSIPESRRVEWVLRVAVALEFIGHGSYAVSLHEPWLPFITVFGFSDEWAGVLMRGVGCLDIVLALYVLWPRSRSRLVLGWMAFWGFFTASLRPLTGASFLDFVERGPNWGAPLALLILLGRACEGPRLRGQPGTHEND